MTDVCGNCKFFNEYKKFVNGNYKCIYHNFTTNPYDYGCYKIQFNKVDKYIKQKYETFKEI